MPTTWEGMAAGAEASGSDGAGAGFELWVLGCRPPKTSSSNRDWPMKLRPAWAEQVCDVCANIARCLHIGRVPVSPIPQRVCIMLNPDKFQPGSRRSGSRKHPG